MLSALWRPFWIGCAMISLLACGVTPAIQTPVAPSVPPPIATSAPTATLPSAFAGAEDLQGTIVIDGSSTVFPISELAAIEFSRLAPNVEIQLGVSGSGAGFRKFCAGETVISDASRPISTSELALCAENQIEFVEVPIAFDGLSVVLHPENDWATCASVADLQRMWEPSAEGEIVNWNQVRPDWPDRPLTLYGAGRDSGTFDYFAEAIIPEFSDTRDDFTGSEDDYLLAQDITVDPNALGFFGYAYYDEYQDRLKVLAIDNGAGCVTPNQTTIASGEYQPLSRPIFIYIERQALERAEVAAFVDYYLNNGERLVREARYTPLPPELYALGLRRVAQRETGTFFGGELAIGFAIEEYLEREGRAR